MSRRRIANSTKTQNYFKIHSEENDLPDTVDGYIAAQFQHKEGAIVPWKTIIFVIMFLLLGTICITFGILITLGLTDEKYHDRALSLTIIGSIMLIPGGYYGYTLLCIWLKRDGYSIDLIPTF